MAKCHIQRPKVWQNATLPTYRSVSYGAKAWLVSRLARPVGSFYIANRLDRQFLHPISNLSGTSYTIFARFLIFSARFGDCEMWYKTLSLLFSTLYEIKYFAAQFWHKFRKEADSSFEKKQKVSHLAYLINMADFGKVSKSIHINGFDFPAG